MITNFNIPTLSIILFAISLISIMYILIVYGGRMRTVRRHRLSSETTDETPSDTPLPKASIVVYTHDDDTLLAKSLPLLLEQQYNGKFEVIVVNDGNANESDILVTQLKAWYPNLYLTFAPDNSRNLSRKKLAITLGVKAAKGEIIVITDANTLVPSSKWLEEMVRPFNNPSTEVVLGYNMLNTPEGHWSGRLVTIFDYVADSVTWLSSAIKGNPYRGCSNNIAYRRDIFFRNKGFSNSLNLRVGDDDLFVNEITTPDNTVVQLSADTIGVSGDAQQVRKAQRISRREHAFTGKMLPKATRRLMAVGEWLMWIAVLTAVAGGFFAGTTNIIGWAIAALLIIALIASVTVIWRNAIITLQGQRMLLSLPLIASLRPLRNIKCNLTCSNRKNQCYTWQ